MIPHMDRFTRLLDLSSIPQLWNVFGYPAVDELNTESLILSEIEYETSEGNIPLAVAEPLDFNTTIVSKKISNEIYTKSFIYNNFIAFI